MPHFTTYPRCFTTRNREAENSISEGDHGFEALYDLYINRKVDTSTWSYRKLVLREATRLLADFKTWVDDQSKNPNVVGYNIEFLKDTLNYIITGTRAMSVTNWLEMCTEVEEIATINRNQRLSAIRNPVLLSTAHVIQKWQSWPNGFEDMMGSLHILFGCQRNPDFVDQGPHVPVGIAD